jgi:DNA-directed RNA polymerase sigma subunit (sigma70/sigma32)
MRLAAQQRRKAIKEKKSRAILLALKHVERLTTRQRQIIALRIGFDRDGERSGVEVAAILGVSRQAVSAVEKAAWRRIQQAEATIPGQLFPARDEARMTVTQAA